MELLVKVQLVPYNAYSQYTTQAIGFRSTYILIETYQYLRGQIVNTKSFKAIRRNNNRRLYSFKASLTSYQIRACPLPS